MIRVDRIVRSFSSERHAKRCSHRAALLFGEQASTAGDEQELAAYGSHLPIFLDRLPHDCRRSGAAAMKPTQLLPLHLLQSLRSLPAKLFANLVERHRARLEQADDAQLIRVSFRKTAPFANVVTGTRRIEQTPGTVKADVALGDALPCLSVGRQDALFLAPLVCGIRESLDGNQCGRNGYHALWNSQ